MSAEYGTSRGGCSVCVHWGWQCGGVGVAVGCARPCGSVGLRGLPACVDGERECALSARVCVRVRLSAVGL